MNQKDIFDKLYNGLNEQQKKAVDTIDGPVMVVAGPGTGKTQILSARIGKILIDTDTKPENILCLTYTDAGAVAMRRRLVSFIGPDAYKVNISTFHAFCNDIIQENLFLFDKTSMDAVSELERIEFLKELINKFPKNHPLKRYRGDVYFETNNLKSLFSTMKREGWTPAFINQKIDEYLADIETRDEFIYKRAAGKFKAGDKKIDKINDEKERMGKLRAAVNEFDRFQQIMHTRNRYDFDDMINWVIASFEENESLLRRYQEKFLYILVDEFQDTSGTQNRLVQLLINYWDKPNVFVVGDDDQSIYRFQGANVSNMLDFRNNYKKDLLTVVLTHNYRSTQPILDISKTLINRNDERLIKKIDGLSKELIAANTAINHLTHPPFIREYETPRQEMADITMQVDRLITEGVRPGKIAVIYKENKYAEELIQYFKLKKISFFSKRSLDILEIPLAKKIITIIRYLASEHEIPYSGDELLFEILHFNWFNIPAIEIAKLSIEVANRQFTENKISLRRLLHEKSNEPPKDLFSQGLHQQLKKAGTIIENLISDVPNVTLQILIERIIRKAGVINQIMIDEEKIWLLQVLTGLFDFIKEETHRNPGLTLHKLVELIDLMEKEGIPLPLIQVTGSSETVNLLTVHGSKGLEFEYVFFAGCNAHVWEKKRAPHTGYRFPDNIFSSQSKSVEEEELRRLFYVALTRTEKHLFISYSRYRNDGKELEPSMFIAEIQEGHALQVVNDPVPPELTAEFQLLELEEQSPEIEKIEEQFVSRLLETFVMNVTALNNYLKCPLEFYFKNLLRIPAPKNEATEFGSAVHSALELLFRNMQSNEQQFPDLVAFLSYFDNYMHRHRESFTKEQFERRIEYGHIVLPDYYNKYVGSWNKIVAIERNVRHVMVNNVPLKGKMDKLEFDGKHVNVVDYKTGDPEKAKPKLAPPNEKNPNGGDYWRQAVFYKILLDHYESRGWQVISSEFDFIEPDNKKDYKKTKLVIRPEDITTVTHQITDVWQKIQRHEFYVGCGKADCHWCNFVKTNNLVVETSDSIDDPDYF
ncbi:MAG: ATP-dependent helicase [Bacteroidetes bacterium]|nr:ATP-dependent helicase [Bacteroidota bacterium]